MSSKPKVPEDNFVRKSGKQESDISLLCQGQGYPLPQFRWAKGKNSYCLILVETYLRVKY